MAQKQFDTREELKRQSKKLQQLEKEHSRLMHFLIWLIMLILLTVGMWYASTPDKAPCYYDVHGNCN